MIAIRTPTSRRSLSGAFDAFQAAFVAFPMVLLAGWTKGLGPLFLRATQETRGHRTAHARPHGRKEPRGAPRQGKQRERALPHTHELNSLLGNRRKPVALRPQRTSMATTQQDDAAPKTMTRESLNGLIAGQVIRSLGS